LTALPFGTNFSLRHYEMRKIVSSITLAYPCGEFVVLLFCPSIAGD
jgi:hypothetical protein